MEWNSIPNEYKEKPISELATLLPITTVRGVPKFYVERWLRNNRLAWEQYDPEKGDEWSGPIPDLIKNPAVPEELKAGLKFFLGYLSSDDDDEISTDGEQYAVETWSILQGLKQVSPLVGTFVFGDAEIDIFYGFAGGRIWKDENEQSITLAKEAAEDNAERDRLIQQVEVIYLDPASSKGAEDYISALGEAQTFMRQAWDEYEAG